MDWPTLRAEAGERIARRKANGHDPEPPAWLMDDGPGLEDTAPEESAKDNASANSLRGRRVGAHSGGLVGTAVEDIECPPVSWLWRDRVPFGALTLGLGLAATLSRGCAAPCGLRTPAARTLILSSEDPPAILRRRWEGLGGARGGLVVVRDENGTLPDLSDLATVAQIGRLAEEHGARLVLVDMLPAYLGRTDGHVDGQVKAAPAGPLRRVGG